MRAGAVITAFISSMILFGSIAGVFHNGDAIGSADKTSSRPTRAVTDVGVDAVALWSETNITPYHPGENITINVKVQNWGDPVPPGAMVNITCIVSDGHDSNISSKFTYTAGLAGHPSPLDNITHSFYFTPPEDPPPTYTYPHQFNVTSYANISGDLNLTNNRRDAIIFVEKNEFSPWVMIGAYNATSGSPDPTGFNPAKTEVGGMLDIPFTLFNLGNTIDMISFSVLKKPNNWSVANIPDQVLGAGQNTTDRLTLDLNVSSDRKEALYDRDYVIRLRAFSVNDPAANHTLDFHVKVEFDPGIEISGPQNTTFVAPGTVVDLNVTLANRGNGNDTFSSNLSSLDVGLKADGWGAYIISGSVSPLLLMDGLHTVRIGLSVPADAHNGSFLQLTFAASSNNPHTAYNRSFTIAVEVLHTYGARIDALESVYHVDPGESTIYMNVTNLGNDADPTLELKVAKQPADWARGFFYNELPAGGIAYHQTAEIGLLLDIPKHTPASDDYEMTVEAWCGVPAVKSHEAVLRLSVSEVHRLLLNASTTFKAGGNSETLEFPVEIYNDGNLNDTFDIEARMAEGLATHSWSLDLSAADVFLAPNASAAVVLSVSVPADAPSDPDLSTSAIENYHVLLSVTSRSHVQTKAAITLMVNVLPRYDLYMYVENTTIVASGDKDGNLIVPVNVTNTGNIKDLIDFSIDSDNDWYEIMTVHRFIPYGEARDALVQLRPYKGLQPGTYTFDLVGTSNGDPAVTRSARITVDIVRFDLKFQNVRINGETLESLKGQGRYSDEGGFRMKPFEVMIITAELVNTGSDYLGMYYGDIAITMYDGQAALGRSWFNVSSLGSMEPYQFELVYAAPAAADPKGTPHNIILKVDAQNTIPESDDSNNAVAVDILVASGGGTVVEDDEGFWDLFMDYFGVTVIALALLVLAITIILALITRSRRTAKAHARPMHRTEERVPGPEAELEAPQTEPALPGTEAAEDEAEDITPEKELLDPSPPLEFESDPDGMLKKLYEQAQEWERPSDFELARDDLEQKLADKYRKGEITKEMYEELLGSLKGWAR